jgi:hypothetical protein
MNDINRRHRRAAAKLGKKTRDLVRDLPAPFQSQLNDLAVLGGFANHVSMALNGLPTSMRGSLASMVFAKCCAHARSITAISMQSSMFDHHAIMTLARMIVEASTMIAYLLDPVAADEWMFRYTLLRLHDTAARIKLLRAFGKPADDLRAGRDELKAELEANPKFACLDGDRKRRLISGEEMFVVGMRSVATKIMGWEDAKFNGVYAYFSAHAHSSPVSFMRMKEHEIDYFSPSETQIEILALSMEVTMACLRRSMLRMIDEHPERASDFHPQLLSEAREQDASCPFFKGDPTPKPFSDAA